MQRKFPKKIKRIVVKVGSSVIATYKMRPRAAQLRSLTEQISKVVSKGTEVILVSSGAVVVGMGELKEKRRPSDLASLQACASVGQGVLMRIYNEFFKRHKRTCAQILLTWDDFDNRRRFNNAGNTLKALLSRGIIPIINENDAISTEEMCFGDNDKLAALVASMVRADLLLILSDVEGLYQIKDGRKKIFREIKEVTAEIEGAASGGVGKDKKNISKGGMSGKLDAIKIATKANVPSIIANGETKNVLLRVLKGDRIGTFFTEREDKVLSRKHWISFGAKPKGAFRVDDGAKKALQNGKASLLLPGIVSWQGHFRKNDVVIVHDKDGQEIARGITNYSVSEMHNLEERKGRQEAIHYDDLVLSER